MVNYKVKSFVLVLVITMLVLTPILFVCCDKPSISQTTEIELQEILGIGEVLSEKIYLYILENPNCSVKDLIEIKGVGDKTLKKLMIKYK